MVGENGFMTAGYVDAGLKLIESLGLYLILVSFTSSRVVPLSVFVFEATRCFLPFLFSLSLSLSLCPHATKIPLQRTHRGDLTGLD